MDVNPKFKKLIEHMSTRVPNIIYKDITNGSISQATTNNEEKIKIMSDMLIKSQDNITAEQQKDMAGTEKDVADANIKVRIPKGSKQE